MDFVPFEATPQEIEARTVLRPGVPPSMKPSLLDWLVRRLAGSGSMIPGETLLRYQNLLDVPLGVSRAVPVQQDSARRVLGNLQDQMLLRVVDLTLYEGAGRVEMDALFVEILLNGRSKYTVVERNGRHRLESRMPEGVQTAAEAVMATESTPGRLLQRAWSAAFEVEPNDSMAYWLAVKAVEAAAFRALGIEKELATLGDAVRALQQRDSNWRLPFLREHTEYPSRDLLLGLMKSLYRGQSDRHGRSEAYSDVTHDEAEAAVFLAVSLVGWFSRGHIKQRDTAVFG